MNRRREDGFFVRMFLIYRIWREMGYGRLRAGFVAFNLAAL